MKTIDKFLLVIVLLAFTSVTYGQKDRDVAKTTKDIVHLDDVIIDGSACVGFDCVNGESFGFDTERLKENNIRLHFDDTSTSASFPNNDWRILINDTNNGGANYFAIQDATANKIPFRVEAGAPNHALYVDDGGRIGLGTSTPVVEVHVVDGDSPTLRLEQDGSSGFTPQTWDVAGNETNFFVRDVTNGSKLPFKIRPNASTNTLVLDTDGQVGIGTLTSDTKLDVRGDVQIKTTGNTTATTALTILNSDSETAMKVDDGGNIVMGGTNTATNSRLTVIDNITTQKTGGVAAVRVDRTDGKIAGLSAGLNGSSFVFDQTGNFNIGSLTRAEIQGTSWTPASRLWIDGTGVGISTTSPGTTLEVNGSASKTGGGAWAVASDRRLKKNINEYTEGLKEILAFKPISFQYNGIGGISDTNTTFVGLIAQEAQEVASHMVSNVERTTTYKNGDEISEVKEDYLMLDPSAIPYMLINSIKEQQAQLDAKNVEIDELKEKVNKLEGAFTALIEKLDGVSFNAPVDHEEELVLTIDELPFIKQNVPNPYTAETTIEYFVPANASTSEIFFYDNQGKLLKQHVLGTKGFGRINIKADELPSGTYVYSLVIDGKMVSSKKMSIQ